MFSLFALMVLCVGPARADWPSEERWVDLTRDGLTFDDAPFDASGPDRLDLVGDSGLAVGLWTVDDDNLYLRMRVSDDPSDPSGPYPVYGDAWGFFIDLDDTDDTFDYALVLADFGATLTLYANTVDEGLGLSDPADEELETYFAPMNEDVSVVQVTGVGVDHDGFGEDEDYFVDFAIPRDDLERLLRIHSGKAFRVGIGTAYNSGDTYSSDTLNSDQANLTNDGEIEDPTEGLSDEIIFDEDGDGVDYPDEILEGTDPTDADTDDDGLDDGDELEEGTDPTDPDTDDDGVDDGTEVEDGTDPTVPDDGDDSGDSGGGGDDSGGPDPDDTGPPDPSGDDTGPPDPSGDDTGGLLDDTGGGLPWLEGDFTGGACGSAPARPAWSALLVGALLLTARRRR